MCVFVSICRPRFRGGATARRSATASRPSAATPTGNFSPSAPAPEPPRVHRSARRRSRPVFSPTGTSPAESNVDHSPTCTGSGGQQSCPYLVYGTRAGDLIVPGQPDRDRAHRPHLPLRLRRHHPGTFSLNVLSARPAAVMGHHSGGCGSRHPGRQRQRCAIHVMVDL